MLDRSRYSYSVKHRNSHCQSTNFRGSDENYLNVNKMKISRYRPRSRSRGKCKREKTSDYSKKKERNRSRSIEKCEKKERNRESRNKHSSFRDNIYSNSPKIESPVSTKSEEIHYPWYKSEPKVEEVIKVATPKIESYEEYNENFKSSKWYTCNSKVGFSNSYSESVNDNAQMKIEVKNINSPKISSNSWLSSNIQSFPVNYPQSTVIVDPYQLKVDECTIIDYDHIETSAEKADEFRRLGDKFTVIDYGHSASNAEKVVLVSELMGNNHDTLLEYGNVVPTLFKKINIPKNPIPFPRRKKTSTKTNVEINKSQTSENHIPNNFMPCPRRIIDSTQCESIDYQMKVLADSISTKNQEQLSATIPDRPWKLFPLDTLCVGLSKGYIDRYRCHERDPRRPENLNI